jgi:HNH endonuclease
LTDSPEATPYPYAYPPSQHFRKHGPQGYTNYSSYRDWLRDEFSFRCVYCLYREQWGVRTASWHLDHLSPQAIDPTLILTYENLLYVCAQCNATKGSHLVPDPCSLDLAASLEVDSTGVINAKNKDGQILIDVLRLNNDDRTRFRSMIIRTLDILATADRAVYRLWMGYPDDLPDLSKLKPNGNTKPDGVNNSFFARRKRGELEEVY